MFLGLSKTLTYHFHYNYIKQKYGSKAKLFTDTDSLTYEIEAKDVYKDFYKSKNSSYFDKGNKKVIGKFKDETTGIPVAKFIGLRSKMYLQMKKNRQYQT